MAKLRVVKNMYDKLCGVTRYTGDEFSVQNEERIQELINSGAVELIKEKPQSDKKQLNKN